MSGPAAAAEAPVVELRRFSKWYGDVVAVADLSFELRPGVTGLLGPNGAGKTTTLKAICGLLHPSQGEVLLFGRPIASDPMLYRAIGVVPDGDRLYPRLTVRSYVRLHAELQGLTPQELGYLSFLEGFVDHAVHDKLQAAQPQTIAHALADSPAGQLAWSGQLFGDALSPDHICTNVAIYWLTNTGASAARFYYENQHADHPTEPTTVPMGLASFAFDFRPIRRFAERDHTNIVSWSEFDRGSHWAAHDAPDLLLADLRQFFARFR